MSAVVLILFLAVACCFSIVLGGLGLWYFVLRKDDDKKSPGPPAPASLPPPPPPSGNPSGNPSNSPSPSGLSSSTNPATLAIETTQVKTYLNGLDAHLENGQQFTKKWFLPWKGSTGTKYHWCRFNPTLNQQWWTLDDATVTTTGTAATATTKSTLPCQQEENTSTVITTRCPDKTTCIDDNDIKYQDSKFEIKNFQFDRQYYTIVGASDVRLYVVGSCNCIPGQEARNTINNLERTDQQNLQAFADFLNRYLLKSESPEYKSMNADAVRTITGRTTGFLFTPSDVELYEYVNYAARNWKGGFGIKDQPMLLVAGRKTQSRIAAESAWKSKLG